MLNFYRRILDFFLPPHSKRRIWIYNLIHPPAWSIRSDLVMHIRILGRFIIKLTHFTAFSTPMLQMKKNYQLYKGERCFIVCTGPSLSISDVEKLKEEFTFGVNTIANAFDQTTWRPTYYVCVDKYCFDSYISDIYNKYNVLYTKAAFLHHKIAKEIRDPSIYRCLIHYGNHKKKPVYNKIRYSDDISICCYDGFTVTNMAIQIAIYMGFQKIYLIGADCNYHIPQLHFTETHLDNTLKNADWVDDMVMKSLEGYKSIRIFAKSKNVEIYNVTRGGMLEIFERKNLDEVLKEHRIGRTIYKN